MGSLQGTFANMYSMAFENIRIFQHRTEDADVVPVLRRIMTDKGRYVGGTSKNWGSLSTHTPIFRKKLKPSI